MSRPTCKDTSFTYPGVGRKGDMTTPNGVYRFGTPIPIRQNKEVGTLSRTKQARLRRLRLDLVEVPWNPEGRDIVRSEMDEIGLTFERLHIALFQAGWHHSYATMRRWLDLKDPSKPDVDEIALLTGVLAGYSADWPKASNLSSPESDYTFWAERIPIPA